MCGIAGVFGVGNEQDAKSIVSNMTGKLKHRGPDAEGMYSDELIALGHRRLAIIDLSDDSNQPFSSADGRYVLVFNGEIYNYKQLRDELTYPFRTNSDTEVVLASYQKWGAECCAKFNGMFAFAVWDTKEKTLFMARDRVGIKPLYFYNSKDRFVFSSEIRSLLSSEIVPKKINSDALLDYLRYQTVHAPQTIIDGVEMLPAGHYLTISQDEVATGQYWNLLDNHIRHDARLSADEFKFEIRNRLKRSVERRLVSDVPFGAFLSGGIDSSIVVGMMRESGINELKTFSVTFEEEEFSEAKYARLIAEKFETDHHEIKQTPEDFLRELPNALSSMDHPSGDGPNTYVVSKATKEAGVTMALSGLGGDELFAGYDIFKRSYELESKKYLNSFPKLFRQLGGAAYKTLRPTVAAQKVNEILKGDHIHFEYTYPVSRQVMLDHELINLVHRDLLPENTVFRHINAQLGVGSSGIKLPVLSKVSYSEITTYMENVLLRDSDQMSMAHALEIRVPFLDHELLEYVFAIPDAIKYPHYPKKLLVESVGDLLPNEVVHRPKMGFTFPWEKWMKNEMKTYCEERIISFADREQIRGSKIKSYWNLFLRGSGKIQWSKIWFIVVLENWLSENEVR